MGKLKRKAKKKEKVFGTEKGVSYDTHCTLSQIKKIFFKNTKKIKRKNRVKQVLGWRKV